MKKILNFITEDYVKENAYLLKGSTMQFMKQRIFMSIFVFLLFMSGYALMKDPFFIGLSVAVAGCIYIYPLLKMRGYKKKKQNEIDLAVSQWVIQLEPLILTNTIPVAIEKSLSICPKAIKNDVQVLSEKIMVEPTNKTYYMDFVKGFHTSDITEIMLSLHQYNFVNKEDILLDFQILHKRLEEIRAESKKKQNEEKSFMYSMLLIVEPFLMMFWVLMFVFTISGLMMGAV